MRKIYIFMLIMMGLILISCELVDKDVPIKVGTDAAPPGIVRIHVAVLYEDTVLAKTSMDVDIFNDGGIAEIYVQPGNDREIVIWGENSSGLAEYIGSDVEDIVAGQKNIFEIQMNLFSTSFNIQNVLSQDAFFWNRIPGATRYMLDTRNNSMVAVFPWINTYIGKENSCNIGSGYEDFYIRVRTYSEIFNIYSNYSVQIQNN